MGVPQFDKYNLAPTPFYSFMQSYDKTQAQDVENQKKRDEMKTAGITRQAMQQKMQQSEEAFPLEQQQLQATVEKIKADTSLTPYEKQLKIAQAAQAGAHANYFNAEASNMPRKLDIEALNADSKAKMATYASAPSTALARTLNTPEMQSLIKSNPSVAKNVATALQNMAVQAGGDAAQQMSSKDSGKQFITQAVDSTGQAPITDKFVQQGIVSGIRNGDISEQDLINMQKDTGDALNRKLTTANVFNQRQFASNLNGLLDQGQQLMPSVVKYAGSKGKLKGGIDAVKSSLGETSPEYADYLLFTRTTVPLVAGEISRTLGKNATDQQDKILRSIADPLYWDSNPEMAMKQYNFLMQSMSMIGGSLAKRPTEIVEQLRRGGVNAGQGTANVQGASNSKVIGDKTYVQVNGQWMEQ